MCCPAAVLHDRLTASSSPQPISPSLSRVIFRYHSLPVDASSPPSQKQYLVAAWCRVSTRQRDRGAMIQLPLQRTNNRAIRCSISLYHVDYDHSCTALKIVSSTTISCWPRKEKNKNQLKMKDYRLLLRESTLLPSTSYSSSSPSPPPLYFACGFLRALCFIVGFISLL